MSKMVTIKAVFYVDGEEYHVEENTVPEEAVEHVIAAASVQISEPPEKDEYNLDW